MPARLAPLRRLAVIPAIAGIVASTPGVASGETPETLLGRGDSAWRRRAEGRRDGRADAAPIGEAIAAYQGALAADPSSIRARARLLRALYFQGRFAIAEEGSRREVYARGRRLAEEGLALLAADLGGVDLEPRQPARVAAAVAGRPESVALFFWAAAHWGLWGESSGRLAAARQGVAAKVRDYAAVVILIDEEYEAAGGLRIRGRLHTEAPRIPLVTGWVDRDLAVKSLERATALAPEDPVNRLYLAEALLRFRPQRRDEAAAMLGRLLEDLPRAGSAIEDESVLADARALLDRAGRGG